jgi:hypothetical protein
LHVTGDLVSIECFLLSSLQSFKGGLHGCKRIVVNFLLGSEISLLLLDVGSKVSFVLSNLSFSFLHGCFGSSLLSSSHIFVFLFICSSFGSFLLSKI